MTAAEKWRLSLLSKFVNFRRRFSAGSPWSREPSESGPTCGRRFRRFPRPLTNPGRMKMKKKSNFTHHLVNVAVSWHALPFNAHRVGLPSCCLQLFQLGQSGVPRTGCRSAVPLSKSLPKGGNEKKRRMGTTKIAAAPVFFLAVVLLAPLLPLFSSLACVRACVYEYVCVWGKAVLWKFSFLLFHSEVASAARKCPFGLQWPRISFLIARAPTRLWST